MSIVALITDFGTSDGYVGSMKGVMLGINPSVTLVDITHAIAPGDIASAAFVLLSTFNDFPPSTIFLAIVDPGVGSGRKALGVKAGPYYFIGPDNGILTLACNKIGKPSIRSLENASFFNNAISPTFHGRDIFGTVAAHLSKSIASFKKLGPELSSIVQYGFSPVLIKGKKIQGTVIYIDRFGNCITSIEKAFLGRLNSIRLFITIKSRRAFPVCACYSDIPKGKPLGIIGSSGFLEISINQGNAAKSFNLAIGDKVELHGE
jgi:S-adenosylmethionine hydrolase